MGNSRFPAVKSVRIEIDMKKILVIFLCGALTLTTATFQPRAASAAEVSVRESENLRQFNIANCNNFFLELKGDITAGDGARLTRVIKELEFQLGGQSCSNKFLFMRLISDGGSVDAAMELGRVIRKYGMRVVVPSNSNCLSSCVLALAAGADRIALGRVGIHRPYFEDLSNTSSVEEIRKRQDKMRINIRSYLAEMDVSPTLFDLMLSISPEKIRILNEKELSDLRLDGKDASFEEREVAQQANFWGLTSLEFRKRNEEVKQQCRSFSTGIDFVCRIKIMQKVSQTEAQHRHNASHKRLDGDDDDFNECTSSYLTGKKR